MDKNYVIIGAMAAAVICAGGWFHEHQNLRAMRQAQKTDTLGPIAEMLRENTALTLELQTGPYAEGDNQFVSAYLIKIRRDGVPKHSDMKQRIDRIVNNNTATLALLTRYSTHATTPAFKTAADQFRDYAVSLRDRWQSAPEIFMAGGNLPVAAPLFPANFPQAIAGEDQ